MQKSSYISNFKKLPHAVLLALLLVLFFEVLNYGFGKYCYISGDVWHGLFTTAKNGISLIPEQNFDILVFGDSYAIRGIDQWTIKDETGLTCFNFATNGRNSVFNSFCMFDNYLKVNSEKPKYVIIGFLPENYRIRSPEPGFLYEYISGNMGKFIKELGVVQSLKLLVPSLRNQPFLRKILENPSLLLAIKADRQSILSRMKRRLLTYYKRKNQYDVKKYNENQKIVNNLKVYRFRVTPFSEKYLMRLIVMAEKNDIRVIYVIGTKPDYLYRLIDQTGQIEVYREFVKQIVSKHPEIIVVDAQPILGNKKLYVNAFHLNRNGSKALSDVISQKINSAEHDK